MNATLQVAMRPGRASWLLSSVSALVFGVALSLFQPACEPTVEESCYRLDFSLEHPPASRPPPCGWGPSDFDPADGYARANQVFVAFEPTADARCEPCDAERFDALLRAKIQEECPGQPFELVDGCYASPEAAENDFCWVTGLYYANFEPTLNGGCLGCDPNTGECTTVLEEPTME